jgi:LysM repeat protein
VVHTVKPGDTLSEISQKYSVDTDDIVSVNNLKNAASIRIGMDLMIPGAIKKTSPSSQAETKVAFNQVATQKRDTSDAKI